MNGIPVLNARGAGIAEAWENSLILLYREGCEIPTMYDKENDPASKDCTMTITVENPLTEPMIHKDFPGGLEDLQEYTMEVIEGIKNELVRDPNNPEDTRWEYTYNERLFHYAAPALNHTFDQIESIVEKLATTPHSRRAQAITWKVWEDIQCYDPPCLQSIWCRVTEEDGRKFLNMNTRFRSNDAYKAAFMNIFALVQLQREIARRIEKQTRQHIELGRYVHQADSYHLYGAYFTEFQERFLKGLQRRSFEERTFHYSEVKEIMDEAKPLILDKVKKMKENN